MIIDFHVHTFPDKIAAKTVRHLAFKSHTQPAADGTVKSLLKSMQEAGIDYSVNLPVATSSLQVEKLNRSLVADMDSMMNKGIINLGCMHPEYENYKNELRFLKSHGIAGIKLHPAYHGMDLDDIRMLRIIDAASELDMLVLVHAGIDIGIYDRDYASVKHILKVIDEIHPAGLILAHMGGWGEWEDVERDLAGARVWLDTAFSIGPIYPNPEDSIAPIASCNLTDEDFVRLSRKHGTDRILFATDSPWVSQSDYVERIRALPFSEEEKEQIFSGNAIRLLKPGSKQVIF